MQKAFVLMLCILSGLTAPAQEGASEYYGPYAFESGSVQLVFSDTAMLRDAPGGAIRDTLFTFAPVRIVKKLEGTYTVGRKKAPWYEVRYNKAGASRSAILWGGTLAITFAERDNSTFAFGLLSYPQSAASLAEHPAQGSMSNTTCAIKAMHGKTNKMQQCLYNISSESGYFGDTMQEENGEIRNPRFSKAKGFPPATKVLVHFYMGGEACGIPFYKISAAWDGHHLIRMPLLESNIDGGSWSYEEVYVYPGEKGGRTDHLVIRATSEEYDDSEKPKPVNRTVSTRIFRWDGASAAFFPVGKGK